MSNIAQLEELEALVQYMEHLRGSPTLAKELAAEVTVLYYGALAELERARKLAMGELLRGTEAGSP
jgi:hypothetical protein